MQLGRAWHAEETPDNGIYFFAHLHEHRQSDNFEGQNNCLRQFISHKKAYLSHLLNLEMPPTDLACSSCGCIEAEFHCLDCYGSHWWCQSCLILCHAQHPFLCPNSGKKDLLKLFHCATWAMFSYLVDNLFGDCHMMVIHVQMVYSSIVSGSVAALVWLQSMSSFFCHWLFPSTFDQPETVFTLDILDYYGVDAMECKTSAQSFLQKLRRVTNNAFPDEVPVCSSISDH